MTDSVGAAAQGRFARARAITVEKDLAVFAVATLAAWAHTVDELRIGEFVALPFALANAALVAMWSRLSRRERIGFSVGFGLFWGLAVIPYHVVPLIQGAATWQNVSGLARVVACVAMVALGISIASRKSDEPPPTN
jgi:hypothetical protein